MSLDHALVHLVAAALPEAMRRRLLRHAGDAALRAEMAEAQDGAVFVAAALGREMQLRRADVERLRGERDDARDELLRARAETAEALGDRDWHAAEWQRGELELEARTIERDQARREAERLSAELRRAGL